MPNLPEGSGAVIRVSVADPGPGGDVTFTAPSAARWHVLLVNITLATHGTAANRTVGLLSSLSAGTAWAYYSPVTTPASTTNIYNFALHLPAPAAPILGYVFNPLPDRLLLTGTGTLRVTSLNGVPGDELSNASIIVEEWIEP